jgi:hypothetical protein
MNGRRKQIWVAVMGGLALVTLLLLASSAVADNPYSAPDIHPQRAGLATSAPATLEVLPASGSIGAMFSISGSGFQATEVVTLTTGH